MKLIKLQQVKELVGLSKSSIYAFIAEGTFPKQVKIGRRAVAWLASDIYAWIDSCVGSSCEIGV